MVRIRQLTLAALGAAISVNLSACTPEKGPAPPAQDRLVEVVHPVQATGTYRAFTGITAARVESDLGFRVQGKIVERLVDTGQTVKKGQVLMRLDPTDYVHAVTTQLGGVVSLKARWEQAAADERRYRGLVASGAVSASFYDQIKATANSIRAQLDAAIAQEKIARNQDDYSLLRAETDGVIMQTLAEPGHVVAAGQTVIRIAEAGPREASVDLPEDLRPALQSDAQAELYDGRTLVPARLRQLSDSADPATRMFEARYVLSGIGADAPLGATVTVRVPAGQHEGTLLTVPVGALDDEGRGSGLWAVDPHNATVSFHPVQIRSAGQETALIDAGSSLDAHTLIVAAGGHELHAGEHVRITSGGVVMQ